MEQQAQFDVTIIRILKINVYVNGLEWRKAHFTESEEKQFSLTIAGTSWKWKHNQSHWLLPHHY